MLSNTLDQLHGSLLFAGKSRPSALFNEDDFDYALELQPCDEYRQVAEALPGICEFDDIDYELYQGDDNWQNDDDYGRIDSLAYHRNNAAAEFASPEVEQVQYDPDCDGEADPLQSTPDLVTKAEYSQRMQLLAKQQRWTERAARRSSIGFQSHFPANDKDIMDRFLLLLAQGVAIRRHQSYKRAEEVILHSSDGCRAINWDPPHRHHKHQKQVLQPHHYHKHKKRQQKQQQAATGDKPNAANSSSICCCCFTNKSPTSTASRRFGHGEHGDEESQPTDDVTTAEKGAIESWFYRLANFGFLRSGGFSDLSILSVHPASREDPTLPGMLATEQLRASRDVYNSELSFSVIFESDKTKQSSSKYAAHSAHHLPVAVTDASHHKGVAVHSLDIECDDLMQYHTLIKGFKLLQEQAARRRELGLMVTSSSPDRLRTTRTRASNNNSRLPNLSALMPFNSSKSRNKNAHNVDPASALFAATRSVDALRAIKIGGGLLEQRPKGNSPDRPSNNEDDINAQYSLHEQRMSNKLPVAQFLGWTSAGTQIWARLRMAGLLVKVSFSWDLRRLILKVKCPRWRLEQMAQQMHLKLKTRDGHLRPFRVSRRDSFVPFGAHGNIFRSSERQQIIDYILRSKIVEGGAELDEHTELGKHIVQRFPLHMYSRLIDLRQVWVRFWRREGPGQIAAAWSPFSASYKETAEWVIGAVLFSLDQLLQQPLDGIAEYFGESMAFYFAFLAYYTRWLIVPAVLGVIVFAVQVTSKQLDNWLCAPYAVFIMLWVALLLAYWRQEESTLAHRWGVLDFEVEETERPQFQGELTYDENSNEWRKVYPLYRRFARYMVSVPVIAMAVLVTLVVMATVFFSQAGMYADYEQGLPLKFTPSFTLWLNPSAATESSSSSAGGSAVNVTAAAVVSAYGSSAVSMAAANVASSSAAQSPPYAQHQGNFEVSDLQDSRFWAVSFFYPSLYGMLASLLAVCFDRVAKGLTEFENHRTGTSYTNHLILKVFSFQFVAIFTSLYYYAFFLPQTEQAFARIAATIVSFMTVGQWWAVFLNLAVPALYQRTLLYQMRAQFAVINRRLFAVSRQLQEKEDARKARLAADPEAASAHPPAAVGETGDEQDVFALQAAKEKLTRRERYLHQARSRCWEEALQSRYDDFADYTALVIQIAFILFFGAVFPLAPLLALINNLALIRLNAFKVCHVRQRPIAIKHSGIGVWTDVLQLLSVGGLLTNCAFYGFVSEPIRAWLLPHVGQGGLVLLLFAYEQLILLFKYWLHVAVSKVPAAVVRAQIRERKSLNRRSFQRHHHLQNQQKAQAVQKSKPGQPVQDSSKDKGRRKKSSIIDWFLRGSLLLPHSSSPVNAAAAVDALQSDEREHKADVDEEDYDWDHQDGEEDQDGNHARRVKAISRRPFAFQDYNNEEEEHAAEDNQDCDPRRRTAGRGDDSPFYLDPPSLSPPPYEQEEEDDNEAEAYDNNRGWEENDYREYLSPPPPVLEDDEEEELQPPEEEDDYYNHFFNPQTEEGEGRLPSADYSELTFEEAAELGKYHNSHEVYYDDNGYGEEMAQPPQKRYSYWDMNEAEEIEEEQAPVVTRKSSMKGARTRAASIQHHQQQNAKRQQVQRQAVRRGSQQQSQQQVRIEAGLPTRPRQASQSRSQARSPSRSPPQEQSKTMSPPPSKAVSNVRRSVSRSPPQQQPQRAQHQQQGWGWLKQQLVPNSSGRRQSAAGGGRGKVDLLQSIAPLGQQQRVPPRPRPELPVAPVYHSAAPYNVGNNGNGMRPTGRASTLKPFQSPPPSLSVKDKAQSPFAFVNGNGQGTVVVGESRENSPHRANLPLPEAVRRSSTNNAAVMSPQQLLQVHYQHQQQLQQTQQAQHSKRGSVTGAAAGSTNPFSFASPNTGRMTRLEFD